MRRFTPGRTGTGIRVLVIALGLALLSACTRTETFLPETQFQRDDRRLTVLLLEPDLELNELSAAGLLIPNAAWSEAGKDHLQAALAAHLDGLNADLILHVPAGEGRRDHPETQLMKLHAAVGRAILVHNLVPPARLPTKDGNLDWTLGSAIGPLRQGSGADLALFVYARDSFSSAGRVAMQMLFAVFGAAMLGGRQVAFASLVDLDSGRVVWFNQTASMTGDLRTADGAAQAVARLLEGIPL